LLSRIEKEGDKMYRCKRCGAFVSPDHESTAEHIHYHCINCMSTGYIKVKKIKNKNVEAFEPLGESYYDYLLASIDR